MELGPNSGHVTFELMAFSLATSHQPCCSGPQKLGGEESLHGPCDMPCPPLPDLYWSPLIEKKKNFILAKEAQGIQQELDLFVVTGIRACKHPSRLSPSVTNAPQESGKSASGNDLTTSLLIGFKECELRPARAVDAKGGWLMMEGFKDAFCSVGKLGFAAHVGSRIPCEKLFRPGFKIHLVVSPCSRV